MKNKDINKIKKNANDLLDEIYKHNFLYVFIKSIRHSLKKNNVITSILITILALILVLIKIGYSKDTISKFLPVVDVSNSIALVMFGAIIMGYTIFQALAQGPTLKEFLLNNESDKSQFHSYNLSFFNTTVLYLFIIIINYILIIFLKSIPENWYLIYLNNDINNFIATILISIYFLVNVYSLLEVKSFIFNLYKCFSINAVATTIDLIEKDDK